MTEETHKALAQRWFREGWNAGNIAVADEIFAPHFVLNGVEVGPEGPKRNVVRTRAGFPDVTFTIEEQIADAERVVTRWIARGTHLGSFDTFAPTGKTFALPGIVIWRIVDGKVVDDHTVSGEATLPQQLSMLLASSQDK